tara:strand:- start:143 stop:877 length:735 start_codon:yes stop_codon:yes gene_type:complete
MHKTYEKLISFVRRALNFNTEADLYVRIRSGPNRRQARKIASGIEIEDQDPANFARELMTRCRSVEGDPVWIELLESGGSEILDSVYLANPIEGDPPEVTDAHSVASLAKVCADMARSADMRADLAQDRLLQMMRLSMEMHRTAVEAESNLMIEQAGDTSSMERALEMVGPIMPLLAMRLGANPAPPQIDGETEAKPSELTPSEAADHLVGSIINLAMSHPEVVTPERLGLLAQIIPETPKTKQ